MSTAAPFPYQDILRALGGALDVSGCTVAVIHLTASGARVNADRETVPEAWSRDALAAETARQRQLRSSGHAANAPSARLLGWQLPLVGAALDLVGAGPYTIMARPEEIFVFNARGYHRSFRHTALEHRAARAPEFRGHATSCPVCDEAESLVPLMHSLADEAGLGLPLRMGGTDQPTHRCRLCGAGVRLDVGPLEGEG